MLTIILSNIFFNSPEINWKAIFHNQNLQKKSLFLVKYLKLLDEKFHIFDFKHMRENFSIIGNN